MAKVVILSGAGISAESGISTFRENAGLWEGHDPKKVAYKGALENNRAQTLAFYDQRRLELKDKVPNKAHTVLSELKKRYKEDIAIITQNVDDLFEKAGLQKDKEVTHLHGFTTEARCQECCNVYDIAYQKIDYAFNGSCPFCRSKKIRPNIVMFEEPAPNYTKLKNELKNCELFIAMGTSGTVLDISSMAKFIDSSILNNLEKNDAIDETNFSKVLYKKATEAIDEIKKEIETFLGPQKQQFHYQCKNCHSEYIFYKELQEFECIVCNNLIKINIGDNLWN